jgi:hypothetical protein
MKWLWLLALWLCAAVVVVKCGKQHDAFVEDNDFAEFEEFDEEEDGNV